MSIPTRHHYLPEFYLKAWALRGTVTEYSRQRSGLVTQDRSPRATGFEKHLYSLKGEPDALTREQVELGFMRKIDDAAARVLIKMTHEPRVQLTQSETEAWAAFTTSMMFRTPARLAWFDEQIRNTPHEFTPQERVDYDVFRQPHHPSTLEDFYKDGSDDDLSTSRMGVMLSLIGSRAIGHRLAQMTWTIQRYDRLTHGLLTCDDPVVTSNGFDEGLSFVILPVGPRDLFIAARNDEAMAAFTTQRPRDVERAINDAIVAQAAKLVIGEQVSQASFIDRRLGKTPASEGYLGRHTWRSPASLRKISNRPSAPTALG